MRKQVFSFAIYGFLILSNSCNNSKILDNSNSEIESVQKNAIIEESYNEIEMSVIDCLNKLVSEKNLTSEEDIMNLFRPKIEVSEGNYSYTITKKEIDATTVQVTLIEDGFLDDSQAGQKTIMILKKENGIEKVVSIKENYKCYKGRGHENWSAEKCL